MTTPVLLDPVLFSFAPDQLPEVLENLEPQLIEVRDLLQECPIHAAGHLNSDYVDQICKNDWRIYQGKNGRDLAKLVASFELKKIPPTAPVTIQPHIDLGETWLAVLAETSSDTRSPLWRNPIILASTMSGSLMPDEHELCYTLPNGPRQRSLVKIGRQTEHPYFERDFDPWRLKTVGPPAGEDASQEAKRITWKRLPRPRHLKLNLGLHELTVKLQTRIEYSPNDEHICFVPCLDWQPLSIEKDRWRNISFRKDYVQRGPKKGETGYQDRAGWIWLWHEDEFHWDVQISEGADKRRVSYTGENLDWRKR